MDYFLVEESIIKREGEFTLNLAADVENFTALPAGYEIARQAEKRWVVQARAPYILFPNAGVATGPARRAVAPRRCPSSPRNQPEETP
ncbi:succinylglutamate desuccinylase [Klebsiella pneumoniae subsp. rhinoscleromatis]|nr:succinylglutamate desuccinylase [Klebsiella pneumoniae subsp. rhinoscleromatis]